jgi:uncharacterized protein (TIRG00374 family)
MEMKRRTPIRQKIFYTVTACAGISLLLWIVMHVGPREILQNLRAFGLAIVLFILLEGVASIFYALATRFCFSPGSCKFSTWTLWKITVSERAISYLTPTAGMGGDVAKWSIFERSCPTAEAASAVMIYRLAYFLSKLLFCVFCAVPILMVVPLPTELKVSLLVGTAFLGGGLLGFLIVQRKGLFAPALDRTVGRLLAEDTRQKIKRVVASFDEQLKEYHRHHGRDFWTANLLLWIGYAIGGVLQAWVFTAVVLHEASPVVPSIIWILGSWSDMVFFFVPAGLGTKEFARVLIFEALNFTPAAGASFALLLRTEELFWAGVGVLVYVLLVPRAGASGSREGYHDLPSAPKTNCRM